MNNYSSPDKLEPRQIILGFYQKVLELSLHELKPCERIVLFGDSKEIIEKEDTRISFIQSVEMMSYAVRPYFDKEMQDIYDKNIIVLGGLGYEIEEKISDKKFKEVYDKSEQETKSHLIITWQLRTAKMLFNELTMLLKRQDFLKGGVYDEDDELEGGQ